MDQVRILDLVAVRVEDGVPLVGITVHALRDLREAVARLHGVALTLIGRCGAGAAALNVGKIRRRLIAAVRVAWHPRFSSSRVNTARGAGCIPRHKCGRESRPCEFRVESEHRAMRMLSGDRLDSSAATLDALANVGDSLT